MSSHCCEVSRLHIRLQPRDPAKELGIPRESDFEGQWDLITELPEDWGKQGLLEGTNKTLCALGTQGKVTVSPQETEPVSEGLLRRHGSAGPAPERCVLAWSSWRTRAQSLPTLGLCHLRPDN